MQRIHRKIGRALFCALAVSLLLSACNNPNKPTPTPPPTPAPTPQPAPTPTPKPAPTPQPAPAPAPTPAPKPAPLPEDYYNGIYTPPPPAPTVNETVKVKITTVNAGLASYTQVGAPYTGAGQLEEVTVDVLSTHSQYLNKAQQALALAVATQLGDASNAAQYKFFKDDTGTALGTSDIDDSGTKIVYVGKTAAATVKAKVTIALITTGQTFTGGSLSGKTVNVPAASGAFVAPFVGVHEESTPSASSAATVTANALKTLINAALTTATLTDGTGAGNVKFFTSATPGVSDEPLDLNNLTPANVHNQTIYVGVF